MIKESIREILLIKDGEIALKGLNRSAFEDVLIKNIRRRLKPLGEFSYRKAQSTIYITPKDPEIDLDEACDRLKQVFGISAFCRVAVFPKELTAIQEGAAAYLADTLREAKTFKVTAKRSDKQFPLGSPEITREVGGFLLSRFHHLKVDVHNPDVTVTVEIREAGAYVYAEKIPGAGGMPVGSSGDALLLLSGGIDSPVAGYMMAKRGLRISAIHFVSPPYTSDRARQKVETLCEELTPYCGKISFYCVPFTQIQEAIKEHCPEELFTIIMRRLMMEIAQRIAKKHEMDALITGESLAQVASQTIKAMACTDAVCQMPVFRPVIGMDKSEIIAISQKIGTFETSILPYDDCCTVFTPKHPKTRPQLSVVEAAQARFDFEPLIQDAVERTEIKSISADFSL